MNVLLDTCTFLWLIFGQRELSATAREVIANRDNQAFLSVVSAWEIAVKYRLKKLRLDEQPQFFVPRYRNLHSIQSLGLDESSVLRESTLPNFHKDPFDRILICQAIEHGLAILTPDPLISQYPVRGVW